MSHGHGHTHDSAGQSFGGRRLDPTGFETDLGEPDVDLVVALGNPDDEAGVLRALSGSRLLVPVVAAPVEIDDSGDLPSDKTSEMAMVTLVAPDGQRAMPVFTGVGSLAAWDEAARPVPVSAAVAAQAAIEERCDVVVVDLEGPQTFIIRPSMIYALAMGHEWLPAHADEFVAESVARAVADEAWITDHELFAADRDGTLGIRMTLVPGLGTDEITTMSTRIGERLATDGEFRARVDGLRFTLR